MLVELGDGLERFSATSDTDCGPKVASEDFGELRFGHACLG